MVTPRIVDGDLLDQEVDVIVNAWNRNIIPWWLLFPQGVSGAIKRRAGLQPFFELGRMGAIPLGGAVKTSAGRLPFKAIIHVAGISMLWRSSRKSIQDSTVSALSLADAHQFKSVAFPVIGAGTGGHDQNDALQMMVEALAPLDSPASIPIVRFRKRKHGQEAA